MMQLIIEKCCDNTCSSIVDTQDAGCNCFSNKHAVLLSYTAQLKWYGWMRANGHSTFGARHFLANIIAYTGIWMKMFLSKPILLRYCIWRGFFFYFPICGGLLLKCLKREILWRVWFLTKILNKTLCLSLSERSTQYWNLVRSNFSTTLEVCTNWALKCQFSF